MKPFVIFDERAENQRGGSLETSCGTMLGLSLNFGIWIKDDRRSRFGGTHRIMITLRFRVRYGREIRRNQNNRLSEVI